MQAARAPHLKKILLSFFVIAAFAVYSWHARNEESSHTVAIKPATTSTSTQSTSSSSQATTPSTTPSAAATASYKDGAYTGSVADAFYGSVQVRVTISGGKLTDVTFLQYPNDQGTSVEINTQAMPYLKQEAISAQSAQVDGVSGATDTSQAFVQSLSAALNQAKA